MQALCSNFIYSSSKIKTHKTELLLHQETKIIFSIEKNPCSYLPAFGLQDKSMKISVFLSVDLLLLYIVLFSLYLTLNHFTSSRLPPTAEQFCASSRDHMGPLGHSQLVTVCESAGPLANQRRQV
jgi:hypothetical protein